MALVVPLAVPPLEPGDRVELVAVAIDAVGDVDARIVSPPVRVLSVGADAIVVAVPAAVVSTVIGHQAGGAIEIVAVP